MKGPVKIVVVAEVVAGQCPVFLDNMVSAAGRMVALGETGGEIRIWMAGNAPGEAARTAAARTGCRVEALHWPLALTPETLKQGLARKIGQMPEPDRPHFILFAPTTMGREAAPGLGALLGACTVSNVTEIRGDGDRLIFLRPVMDNTRILSLAPAPGKMAIVILAPEAAGQPPMDAPGPAGQEAERVTERVTEQVLPAVWLRPSVQRLELRRRDRGRGRIREANIVVGAGRGMGEQENLVNAERLAERLPHACTGASRPLVDQGWMPYSRQVGITGAAVAPDLYIACGISGASQHLAGMAGAKWVVSINRNADAPICRHSDLCIVADVNGFITAFLESE